MASKVNLILLAVWLVVCGIVAGQPVAAAESQPATRPAEQSTKPAGVTILCSRRWSADGMVPTGTIWRSFETWRTDVARTAKGEVVPVDPLTPRAGRTEQGELVRCPINLVGYAHRRTFAELEIYPAREIHGSPYPPVGWQEPDFDDDTWIRDPYPQRQLYGCIALRCLRGKFEVSDPKRATELILTVRFRGGVVAYLNGREVGRAYLPKGEIKPDVLAEDYPKEAYIGPEGVLFEQGLQWLVPSGVKAEDGDAAVQAAWIENGVAYSMQFRSHSIGVDAASKSFFASKDPEVVARYKSRCRTLEAKIPPDLLRKGINVLALEIHRAPAWEGMFTAPSYYDGRKSLMAVSSGETWWNRAELEDVKLTAPADADWITPNVTPPKGLYVWNHPACVELDPSYYPDPNEPLRPIRLRGLKNGTYSGVLVVSSTGPIRGLKVQAMDLKGPGGTLAASSIQIAYPRFANGTYMSNNAPGQKSLEVGNWPLYDPLEPLPPKEIKESAWPVMYRAARRFPAMQPVWVTVRVPRTAPAGEYRGTVTVEAEGAKPVAATLELEVVGDWVLPDSQAFKTYIGLLECPDAVASYYKVGLWSEQHWQLMDKVFEVLGQLGTKDLYVPLVAKTHLGNACSMVLWVKQADGSYACDTSIAEKYLDLAIKHLGKIPTVCLYVSTRSQYGHQKAVDQPIVTEMDPATKELKELLPPKWGTPEAQVFWKPVIERMRDILARHGLENSMFFGYLADGIGPVAEGNASGLSNHFADLRTISPTTKWLASSHMPPNSWRAGPTLRGPDFLGVLSWMWGPLLSVSWMDENDTPWWKPMYAWRDRTVPLIMLAGSRSRSATLTNDHCPNVARWRVAPEAVLLSKKNDGYTYQGLGPWGADFWGNECVLYDSYHNVALSETPVRWLVGPGQDGPVPTCRTRMLQEGLQEAEARIFVQEALLDEGKKARLGADLARRCREACDERTRSFTYMSHFRYSDSTEAMPRQRLIPDVAAWEDAAVRLYRLADEVAKALAKP